MYIYGLSGLGDSLNDLWNVIINLGLSQTDLDYIQDPEKALGVKRLTDLYIQYPSVKAFVELKKLEDSNYYNKVVKYMCSVGENPGVPCPPICKPLSSYPSLPEGQYYQQIGVDSSGCPIYSVASTNTSSNNVPVSTGSNNIPVTTSKASSTSIVSNLTEWVKRNGSSVILVSGITVIGLIILNKLIKWSKKAR